jgi:hypothetical protein
MNYYNLEGVNRKVSTSAGAIEKLVAGTEVNLLEGLSMIPFRLELFRISFAKGQMLKSKDFSDVKFVWEDYLANQFAWPLMSEQMKSIVEAHLSGKEGIDWITAPVEGISETKNYFVPRFSTLLDVLDLSATIFSSNGDFVVNPCFSKEKVASLAMFFKRPEFWKITSSLVVNEPLMKALKKAKLSGIVFSPARSS